LWIIASEKIENINKQKMNTITKKTIMSYLISGLIFASLSSGFDYYYGISFSVWKFIIKATFFGLSMAIIFRYNFKKK
jgi:hypothetical protein